MGIITATLVLLHVASQYVLVSYRSDISGGIINAALARFNLDAESSIPTWYSQTILALAAASAAIVAYSQTKSRDRWRRHWWLVAGVILYASIDEGAMLHEQLNWLALPERLGIDNSYLMYAWVLPALFIVALLFLLLVRFWWNLPNRTKWLLAASVLVFVGGAIGVEMTSSNFLYDDFSVRAASLTYKIALVVAEEGLEQLGVILLIYTLLDYARTQSIKISTAFRD